MVANAFCSIVFTFAGIVTTSPGLWNATDSPLTLVVSAVGVPAVTSSAVFVLPLTNEATLLSLF